MRRSSEFCNAELGSEAMTRPRATVVLVVCMSLMAGACRVAAPDPSPTRLVLVTIDTLRADALAAYGGPVETPHLDALGARGVRFDVAISPTPLTLPSHASLLTGLDPTRHGIRDNSTFRLDPTIPTLAERFAERGFETAAFVGSAILDRQYGLDRGFGVYGDRMGADGSRFDAQRPAAEVVDEALAWLASAGESFFLWVHVYDPHGPYEPPPPFDVLYGHSPYQGEIAYTDAMLGRLFDALAARFPGEGTWIAVTADHGESGGEHGERTHGYTVYDATQRVPLLMAGSGIARGQVAPDMARVIDLAPTFVERFGLAPLPGIEGVDLSARLQGERVAESPPAYLEALGGRLHFGWSPALGLRTQRFKLIREPRAKLFDVVADPRETHDLAPTQPQEVARLEAILAKRLADGVTVRSNLEAGDDQKARLVALGYVAGEPTSAWSLSLESLGGADPSVEIGPIDRAMRELRAGGAAPEAALAGLAAPEALDPQSNLAAAELALRAADPERALAHARASLAERSGYAPAWVQVGEALAALERTAEAEDAFDRALALDQSSGEPYAARGRVAEAAGDRAGAKEAFEQALEARQPSTEAIWRLAALRIEDGQAAEAKRLLAELPGWLQHAPGPVLRLARAEQQAGANRDALQRVRLALQHAPGSEPLRRALEDLLSDRPVAAGP